MVETAGKKLQQARLRKQISIEEAAHETKIRQGQLANLEKDDFTNFPNMTYAKGFLVIYAKYLGVDVSEFVAAIENPNPVGGADYEYLSNKPAPINSVSQGIKWGAWKTVGIAALVLVVTAFVADLVVSFLRLGDLGRLAEKREVSSASAAATPPPAPVATPAPQNKKAATPAPTPEIAAATPTRAIPVETPAAAANIEVRRAEPVAQTDLIVPPPASQTPSATPPPTTEKTLTLQPVKKTWVKITQDVPSSPPVFEDWYYPDSRPLTFKGSKFWIEIRDRDAVKITKDGEPVPYDVPGVTIE